MSVRIIQQGKLPEEKFYEATCYGCSTKFEFQRKDAKYVSDQRDGDFLQIRCPFCSDLCSIDVDKYRR